MFSKKKKKPQISLPSNFEHRVHTGFDKKEGRYIGLPLQWASIVGNNQILKSSNRPMPVSCTRSRLECWLVCFELSDFLDWIGRLVQLGSWPTAQCWFGKQNAICWTAHIDLTQGSTSNQGTSSTTNHRCSSHNLTSH